MDREMKKPTAVVIGVGASKGIGGALCQKFASEGYHVFIAGHTKFKIEKLASSINSSGYSAEAIVTDTSKEKDIIYLFDKIMEKKYDRLPADLVVYVRWVRIPWRISYWSVRSAVPGGENLLGGSLT